MLVAAPEPPPAATDDEPGAMILPISARHPAALATLAREHAARIAALPAAAVAGYCRAVATGRDAFDRRLAVVGSDAAALVRALEASAADCQRHPVARRRVAFMFAGQGTLRPGMGQALAAGEPAFRDALARADAVLALRLGAPLASFMWGGEAHRLAQTDVAQPVLTAFHMALAETWRDWGVEAEGVCGHSAGEIAAAWYAGALGWEDALTLAARRGATMRAADASGAMLAVLAPASAVATLAKAHDLDVAAINGDANTVVSGDAAKIERLAASAREAGIVVQRLTCDRAFHSRHMTSAVTGLGALLDGLDVRNPRAALFASTMSGRMETVALADPAYWQRQARGCVRFADARAALASSGFDTLVEIGPGTALTGIVRAERSQIAVTASCAGAGGTDRFRHAVATLFETGVDIDWRRRLGRAIPDVELPTYPFQRQEHWAAAEPLGRGGVAQRDAAHGFAYVPAWVSAPPIDAADGPVTETVLAGAVAAGRALLADAALGVRLDRYARHEDWLEATAGQFVVDAMATLGAAMVPGETFIAGALAERVGILPAHRRLFARMLAILAEDGFLIGQGDSWRVAGRAALPVASVGDCLDAERGVEHRLLERCGSALAAALVGRTDPVELLFPRGDSSDVQELYRNGPVLNALNGALAAAVGTIVAALPAGRRLRVLEVGAGTGGSTRAILSALPADGIDYWFTDVSPLFLARAQDEWRDRAGMTFRSLDAERALDEQDIPCAAFDIVIAANVLHATRDVAAATGRIAAALKPGGALLLIEGVRPQRWVDLTFGLTEGWWRFADVERRPDYPLLSTGGWLALLAEIGLADATAIAPAEGAAQNVVVARAPLSSDALRPRWLLLGGARDGPLAAMAAALAGTGESVMQVSQGDAFARTGSTYVLDPTKAGDWARLLSDAGAAPVIVHGWSCEVAASDGLIEAGETLCLGLVRLAQAIDATSSGAKLRLVTLDDASAPGCAAAGALTAAAQCIGFDLDGVDVRCVSVGIGVAGVELVDECLATGEGRTRRLQGDRAVARLLSLSPRSSLPIGMRADGAYLVTGGLGGAGLETALWLADRGARTLVLAGRIDTPTPMQEPAIAALRRRGVRVELRAIDIGDEHETMALIGAFGAALPALRGVFHAAGVIDPITPVQQLDEASVRAMLRPKLRGGELLDAATRTLPLDCFVLFSSGASVWGFRGETHYAAANGYLDALAARRRAAGLPGSVVNWGFLSFGGMTRDDSNRTMLRDLGVNAVEREAFQAALDIAASAGAEQLVFADNDWSRLAQLFAVRGADAFFTGLPGVGMHAASSATASAIPAAAEGAAVPVDLAGLSPARRAERIEDVLIDELRNVLARREDDLADARGRGFLTLGMDSLMAVDFKHRMEQRFGVALPATLIFDHPTPAALARHLDNILAVHSASFPLATTARVSTPPATAPASGNDLRRQLESLLED